MPYAGPIALCILLFRNVLCLANLTFVDSFPKVKSLVSCSCARRRNRRIFPFSHG